MDGPLIVSIVSIVSGASVAVGTTIVTSRNQRHEDAARFKHEFKVDEARFKHER